MVISKTLEENYRHIFVIGDIHGRAKKLEALLEKIPLDLQKDYLIFLGDYIDRGRESKKVVDILWELKYKSPRVFFLRGNHEQMFMDFLMGIDNITFLWNGGRTTLSSYGYFEDEHGNYIVHVPKRHLTFFEELPHYIETQDYIFVHAGLRPGIPLESQDPMDLLWIRHEFIFSPYHFGRKIIFGHTPFYEPFVMDNKIGIDTGAGYGKKLTCLQLPEMIFYQS